MTARYLIGDVFDRLAEIPDGSVDLVITSPPFLALRSYLPADHPDKSKEIGSEATPAAFLDVMLAVMAELRRVTAPHGSVCIELGDTYAGSTMSGGDDRGNERYPAGRSGSDYDGSARRGAGRAGGANGQVTIPGRKHYTVAKGGDEWPLAKSRALIPELFRIALAYGINPLTGQPSPAGKWLIRNVVTWCRPNPPVGALGDKWRPATSDVVVACTSPKRYWDDLATRRPSQYADRDYAYGEFAKQGPDRTDTGELTNGIRRNTGAHPSGAPLLDYWEIPLLEGEEPRQYGPAEKPPKVNRDKRMYTDPVARNDGGEGVERYSSEHPSGAPLLDYWEIPPTGYKGSHYAVYPPALVEPLVKAMCPEKVCKTCGMPRRRIVEVEEPLGPQNNTAGRNGRMVQEVSRIRTEAGWTDCGHDNYRPGLILDPFAGSGTTLLVATGHGHDAIGIDLDERNAELALERVGPFLLNIESVVSDATS